MTNKNGSERVIDVKQQNLKFVTALRGIAALMVASMHLFAFPSNGSAKTSTLIHVLLFPTRFGQFAVFLFLALSGYSLLRSERIRASLKSKSTTFWMYMERRLWRITPVYYISILLGIVGTLLFRNKIQLPNTPELTWGGIISHLVYLHSLNNKWLMQANPALWTIAAEMQCYLLFPMLIRFKTFKTLFPASLFLYVTLHFFLRFSNIGLFSLMPYFLMGIIIGQFSLSYRIPNKYLYLALIPSSYLIITENFDVTARVTELLRDAIFFFSLFLILEKFENLNKFIFPNWIVRIGNASYSLYACHYPLAYSSYWMATLITHSFVLQLVLMALIGIPLITLVTFAIYKFAEIPSLSKLRTLK